MARIGSTHHVLRIEHLLCQLGDRQGAVLLRAAGGQRCKSCHKKVKTREGNQIDGDLTQIAIELTWKAQAGGYSAHCCAHEMVQIAIGGGCQLQGAKANIVQCLVVQQEALICILDELMERQHCIVWLDDRVTHLWRRDHRERLHDTVRILLSDLRDQECAHARACATTQRMAHLEPLEAIATLRLLAYHIEHTVNQLSSLGVVSFRPIVAGTSLSEDKIVGPEELAKRASAHAVHCSGFQIHQNCSGNIPTTSRLIVVDVNTLQLQVGVTVICSSWVNAVLIGDDLPELRPDLVAALSALHMHELAHCCFSAKDVGRLAGGAQAE